MIRYASLCAGIGGFDKGLDASAAECVLQCEIDKQCRSVLRRHYPNAELFEDVYDERTIAALRRLRPDILCFGSPCVDVSVAGRRAGISAERSSVFFRCMECAFEAETDIVCFENVPGLFSSNKGRDFATVLEAFTGTHFEVPENGWRNSGVAIGPLYKVAWAVLDAQWFGVPQRRRRIFIVGHLRDAGFGYEVLFERKGVPWDSPPSRETRSDITPLLEVGARTNGDGNRDGDGIGEPGDVMYSLQAGKQHGVAATLNSGDNDGGFRSEPGEHIVAHTLRSEGAYASEDGTGRRTPLGNETGGVPFVFEPRIGRNDRGQPSQVAHSLRAHEGGTTQDSRPCVVDTRMAVRRLVPRECERLQGFSDNYTAWGTDESGNRVEISDSARYRMLGNAVAVPVARWIGQRIAEISAKSS